MDGSGEPSYNHDVMIDVVSNWIAAKPCTRRGQTPSRARGPGLNQSAKVFRDRLRYRASRRIEVGVAGESRRDLVRADGRPLDDQDSIPGGADQDSAVRDRNAVVVKRDRAGRNAADASNPGGEFHVHTKGDSE